MPEPAWPADVRSLAAAVAENLVTPRLRLVALQRQQGLADHNMIARFRRHVGMTPKQHRLYHRMELAKRLLRQAELGTVSITEMALALGFERADYFSVVFKKHTGCRPSAYRRG